MIRVHIHLKAADLNSSGEFYEKFFGAPPVKLKSDQLKFLPALAPLNLTISPARHGEHGGGSVNHLGIEVESSASSKSIYATPERWAPDASATECELLLCESEQVLGDRSRWRRMGIISREL